MNLSTPPARLLRLLPGLALLPLLLFAGDATQQTVITSDRFDMKGSDTDTTSVFDGHVVVTATGLRLECNHLVVVSARIGDKDDTIGEQDRFKSLVATGNVRIVQGDRVATSGRAEVLPLEDRITLTENPMVVDHGGDSRNPDGTIDHRGDTTATAEEIYMLRNERQVRGKNIRLTGPPLRDLGFDPKQPPPAPDAQKKAPSP